MNQGYDDDGYAAHNQRERDLMRQDYEDAKERAEHGKANRDDFILLEWFDGPDRWKYFEMQMDKVLGRKA